MEITQSAAIAQPRTGGGRTVARLSRQLDRALAPLELTPGQYRLLAELAEGTEASTALARKLAVSPPSVTTMVDGLVARGAVERSAAREDRRRVNLALTEFGYSLFAAADDAVADLLDDIVGALGDPDEARVALDSLAVWERALDIRAQRNAQQGRSVATRP